MNISIGRIIAAVALAIVYSVLYLVTFATVPAMQSALTNNFLPNTLVIAIVGGWAILALEKRISHY